MLWRRMTDGLRKRSGTALPVPLGEQPRLTSPVVAPAHARIASTLGGPATSVDPTFQLRSGFASLRPGDPGACRILRCAGTPHSFRTAPDVATETRSNLKCFKFADQEELPPLFGPTCEAA